LLNIQAELAKKLQNVLQIDDAIKTKEKEVAALHIQITTWAKHHFYSKA
jgi:hypothetical protein